MEYYLEFLRNQIIGQGTYFNTPYGARLITYADYTASGRSLAFIEKYMCYIQEYYANTHTDDSYTGQTMTELLHKAETNIKNFVNASNNNYLIPVGTGTTGAIAKLCEILGLYLTPGLKHNLNELLKYEKRYDQDIIKDIFKNMTETKPVVFISPYEHHSNYLIWNESFAEVVEIELNDEGEMDLIDLKTKLNDQKYQNRVKIGSFSAASNITGLKTNVYEVARILHQHQGLVFFDFAACAPYVKINMNYDKESYFDAIFLSPHKFIGGPGSSGLLIIHKDIYSNIYPPTVAGGGTVDYVSSHCYDYNSDVETREKAGTPGILQIIKASLALELKEHIGCELIETIEQNYIEKAMDALSKNPNILILGHKDPNKRQAILSFNIKYKDKLLHHRFVSKLLNDLFGIQSRAGCACAGPYGHRLLNINYDLSKTIRQSVNDKIHSLKPGFVRVNFHYLMTTYEVDFILDAIMFIASYGHLFLSQYTMNLNSGSWHHLSYIDKNPLVQNFGIIDSMNSAHPIKKMKNLNYLEEYHYYLEKAKSIAYFLKDEVNEFKSEVYSCMEYEKVRWFHIVHLEMSKIRKCINKNETCF